MPTETLTREIFGNIGSVPKAIFYALAIIAGFDGITVEEHPCAGPHETLVSIHGVLIQTQQQVQLVSVGVDLTVADANGQKDVPASDNRLISVVGVEVKAAADEHSREDVAGGGDSLSGRPSNGNGNIEFT